MTGEKEVQKAYESILGQHFEEAVEWFQKAIELEPDNDDYHYKLSITYARSGKLKDALYHAERALKLDPFKPEYDAHIRLLQAKQLAHTAERLIGQGGDGLHMAVAYLRQALQLDPLQEGAYMLLAAAHAGMNDFQEAIAVLRKLMRLNPEHRDASALLTEYQNQLSNYLEEY